MREFDSAVARIIAPRLKALGFLRRRLLWNRRNGGTVEAIELQQSSYNTSLGAQFTVNLGLGRAAEGVWLRPFNCDRGGKRIGGLRPEREDYWWRYDPTDTEETGAAVRSALDSIETYALPFLARGGRAPEPTPPLPQTAEPRTPEPWNGWDGVARGAVARVEREVTDARPKLAWATFSGALDIDPKHLAIHYVFATDDDLAEAERNGLQARLRELTLSLLGLRGYASAALEHVGIGFASQADIDRVAGGNADQYFM